jgi:tRNA-dihydrouridine synthase 1
MEELMLQGDSAREKGRQKEEKKSRKHKKERKKEHKKRERRESVDVVEKDALSVGRRLHNARDSSESGGGTDAHASASSRKDGLKSKKRKLCDQSAPREAKNGINRETSASSSTLAVTKSRPSASSDPKKFPYKYVLAPMVGASELAFRLLCRKYGADLCYTPMMDARRFANDDAYRTSEFQTCPWDRPLVCHFSANRPEDFAAAVKAAAPHCDAVDLNLGCPQRTAFVGHFGSYLLDPQDRQLVCSIIRAGVDATGNAVPICCKIRLLDTVEETVRLCQQLEEAGASWIAIHARYRATWERKGPGARDGPALLDQVAEIKKRLKIPVIANGNVISFDDVETNLQFTRADAIMSAEGILDNPALFLPRLGARHGASTQMIAVPNFGANGVPSNGAGVADENRAKARRKIEKRLREIKRLGASGHSLTKDELEKVAKKASLLSSLSALNVANIDSKTETVATSQVPLDSLYEAADSKLTLAREYVHLVLQHPVKIRSVVFHVRRILKEDLLKYQLLEDLLGCEHVDQVQRVLDNVEAYIASPKSFVYDQAKANEQKEALERKKREEGKRKEYEARMIRKAKREGKDPNHYLSIGAVVPSIDIVSRLKKMSREAALEAWKRDHSQHCLSYHLDPDGCKRGRSCAFLHVDVNDFVEGDEVAG